MESTGKTNMCEEYSEHRKKKGKTQMASTQETTIKLQSVMHTSLRLQNYASSR